MKKSQTQNAAPTTPRRETRSPTDLMVAREGFGALGALLSCTDETAWQSMARPSAKGLGVLVKALTARLVDGLEGLNPTT